MENRRPLQGTLNILSFNRHFYFAGALAMLLVLWFAWYLHWPLIVRMFLLGGFLYGLCIPLAVSAYVYDFSGYYRMTWLNQLIQNRDKPLQIVNINAGFDESSYTLQTHFPEATIHVFDFYDPAFHTEPAIKRARKVSRTFPNTRIIQSNSIPLPDDSVEYVFLLLAAHEIRVHAEKVALLKECKRICKSSGHVIMAEHLRDLPNFLAFSIGFTHFFSRKTWHRAFAEAGWSQCTENKFTPFISIFQAKPHPNN